MNDNDDEILEEEWVSAERQKVIAYLERQGCRHGGVGEWPAFHVDPYVALWAVQSLETEGYIGWWAISGDVPTDYMSSSSGRHPRDAMRHLSTEWQSISDFMASGEAREGYMIGTPETWPDLAPLLKSRAEMIREWADDDDLWDE